MKEKKDIVSLNLRDTGNLLRIFDSSHLTGADYRASQETVEKIEKLHKELMRMSIEVHGKV